MLFRWERFLFKPKIIEKFQTNRMRKRNEKTMNKSVKILGFSELTFQAKYAIPELKAIKTVHGVMNVLNWSRRREKI